MRAGYAAVISAALTALILTALLPQIAPNIPYLPRVTETETLTKTATLTTTAWKTTTEVRTETLTQTETQTKILPTTTTLTTTTTEVRTTTKTQTTTKTETVTTTTTVTRTEVVSNFQYLNSPDKVIQLVEHANKTLIVFVPYAEWGHVGVGNRDVFSPTVGKILNATLQAYEQRKVDAYVVVAYDPICTLCKTNVKDTFIQYLNRLNATLPPKHVLETNSQVFDFITFSVYPFKGNDFLIITLIDGRYMALIEPGPHPPTNDTRHAFLLYDPAYVDLGAEWLIKTFRNFDNPNSDDYWLHKWGVLWVWDGCKSHESP